MHTRTRTRTLISQRVGESPYLYEETHECFKRIEVFYMCVVGKTMAKDAAYRTVRWSIRPPSCIAPACTCIIQSKSKTSLTPTCFTNEYRT